MRYMTLHSVTEIAPKSPFLRVDRSHTRNGFRARAIRHSVNQRTLFTGQSLLCGVKMCLQYFFLHNFFFSTQDARRRLSSSFSYRGASIPPDCDCRVWKSNFCLCGGWSIRKNLSRFPDRGELRSMKRLWPSPAPSSFVNIFNNVLLSGQNSLVRLIMKPLFWLWLHHVTDRNCVYQFFHW